VPEIAEIMLEGGPGGDRGGRRGGWRGGGGRPHAGSERQGIEAAAVTARFQGAGREGAARFSLLNEPEPLLAADADVDGKVTLAEWTRATTRRFAVLDKPHSGRLTLDSLRPAPKTK